MQISYVKIENYRNFKYFETTLSKLSVIIGENDSGKSNFIKALSLPLSSNNLDYTNKRLGISDINLQSLNDFYASIKTSEPQDIIKSKIPSVKITIRFTEVATAYEKQIVRQWLNEKDGEIFYEIRYEFKPKDENAFIELMQGLIAKGQDLNEKDKEIISKFSLPIEHYDYSIISTNNNKQISYADLKNITINTIYAERDDFSESNSMKSNSILTKLLQQKLSETEKNEINKAYIKFFKSIEAQDNFQSIFQSDEESFSNIKNHIEGIKCIPNLANLKNILSNITLGYGEEFLHQKGLGQRNLIYIFIFFLHFKSIKSHFNLSCVEEPESHLSSNNLNLAIDYIRKSVLESGNLFQTILTSHNPNAINKLEFNHVIAFSGNRAISFKDADSSLISYLTKRPNFDILKLLFSNRVILVEGPSEEMFINTLLSNDTMNLNSIDVISIGQKGFRMFLDIWLLLNKNNSRKKIGIARDFDNQLNAKKEHDKYAEDNENIFIRTTTEYTLEDEIATSGKNCKTLATLFGIPNDCKSVSEFMKSGKTEAMLKLCDLWQSGKISITSTKHISELIDCLK
jgi:putative ATP-dependent endonuclease of the OLD family